MSGVSYYTGMFRRMSGVLVVAAGVACLMPAAISWVAAADDGRKAATRPLSPEEALAGMQLHPDLRIELVAAEPDVVDPVAIAFDETGRLWVAEMSDYPNGPQNGRPPQSRIRTLTDRDGDGRYETSQVFADGLLFANGVQPWKGGVIVTMAGEVAYLRDNDGDGRADTRETWFTGFQEENPQLRANHPTLGIDNHVYVANGLRGGTVVAKKADWAEGAKPVSISGMDFRFDPLSGRFEAVSGVGQFGLTFDDFGNRFVCSNRNPCKHIVLDDRYAKRNRLLAIRNVTEDVSPPGELSRVFAISRTWTTSTLHAGQFTAACGVTIYRGDALPDEFKGNSFTCEPTGNLVHRDVLSPKGATFTSRYGRDGVEFLASRDEWFRPVNLANGPDGALYVVDMYRAVIEHPQFMPTELKNRPDLYEGNTRGRIYRIVPAKQTGAPRTRLDVFANASAAELVSVLEHPNAWHRETAARLLLEQRDSAAVAKLTECARNGKTPQARAHALWLLDAFEQLTPGILDDALQDSSPRVREQAVRLSEPLLKSNPKLVERVLSLATDTDGRVRFQVALSLGEAPDSDLIVDKLAAIAVANASDSWTRTAVLTSVPENPLVLLRGALSDIAAKNLWDRPGIAELAAQVCELVGARRDPAEIQAALELLGGIGGDSQAVQFAAIEGLGQGLSRRGKSLAATVESLPKDTAAPISRVFQRAIQIAENDRASVESRRQAISLLRFAGFGLAGQTLMALAAEESNQALRIAAVETLSTYGNPEIGPLLLEDLASQTPAVYRAMLSALLANTQRTHLLLEAVESGEIAVTMLDPGSVNRLARHRNPEIRKKSKQLLAEAIPADRQQVLADYGRALELEADPNRGKEVFARNCAICHKIGGTGVNVAPDIADSRTRTPAALLTDILDPNRAIDNNYFSYTVATLDGKILTGIIATETASSITLRQQENKTVTILREEIDVIRSNGVSLMPVGLEKNISVEQMADLISFIKNWRYLNGRVPLAVEEATD